MLIRKEKSLIQHGYIYYCKCDTCNKIFKRKAYWVERTNHQFCNQICASKYKSIEVSGKGNNHWRGGLNIRGDGYLAIYDKDSKKSRPYKMQHRLIMEKYLGRELLSIEIIHHINGDRKDNRIENLQLFANSSEHRKYHNLHKS